MKGKYRIVVQNKRLHYEFEIKRNITIIQGNSATGKTTLIEMLRQAENLGISSGVEVISDAPCTVLGGRNWKWMLQNLAGNIIFLDEDNTFINTEEFAAAVQGSNNYFVLITRENLYNLPYSVEEIYGIHSSGKYQNTQKVYQEMYRIYSDTSQLPVMPEKVIVEDSHSGYEFFRSVCSEKNILCESAGGKSNIFTILKRNGKEEICVIADGAAIGAEMNALHRLAERNENIKLYLPESFEWLILASGLIAGTEIKTILKEPENYIDSRQYLSWERYFTKLLIDKTEDTYLKYRKSKLNQTYLHEKNKEKILKSIRGIEFT